MDVRRSRGEMAIESRLRRGRNASASGGSASAGRAASGREPRWVRAARRWSSGSDLGGELAALGH